MALGDMFLRIDGAKQGLIKGESQDTDHKDEIDVAGWSWGMESHSSLQGGQPAEKTSIRELTVVKHVDKASTALMSSLRNNELIKKATLTVRKAGQTPLEYYRIVIEEARLTSLNQQNDGEQKGPELHESITIAGRRFSIEYTPQGEDGQLQGVTTFTAEL